MKYLLIGNKGALSSLLYERLRTNVSEQEILSYEIDKQRYPSTVIELYNFVRSISFDVTLIYVGGEISSDDKMLRYNFIVPRDIIDLLGSNLKRIVYLSSLSVFRVNGLRWNARDRPESSYQVSKHYFDVYVRSLEIPTCVVYPAAILSENRFGAIGRVYSFFQKSSFLSSVFSRARLSYIHRDDLVSILLSLTLCEKIGYREVISANEIGFSKRRTFFFEYVVDYIFRLFIFFASRFFPVVARNLNILRGQYLFPKGIEVLGGVKQLLFDKNGLYWDEKKL